MIFLIDCIEDNARDKFTEELRSPALRKTHCVRRRDGTKYCIDARRRVAGAAGMVIIIISLSGVASGPARPEAAVEIAIAESC